MTAEDAGANGRRNSKFIATKRCLVKRILKRLFLSACLIFLFIPGCAKEYRTFADRPGFREYYKDRCAGGQEPVADRDRDLLDRYRPRFVLPPGGVYPIDFYRDYIPYTSLVSWPGKHLITEHVTKNILIEHRDSRTSYLKFDRKRFISEGLDRRLGKNPAISLETRKPVVYGRVYREQVSFSDGRGGSEVHPMIFLKYNLLFPTSGLPADLSFFSRALAWIAGLNLEDWHQLDNFVAVHVALDTDEKPVAVILAQHNHHRTYLLGKDIPLPEVGRLSFDIALRSNEIYPSSSSIKPVRHRVIRWALYLDYLLSGENGPFLKGFDVTAGRNAGGSEFAYVLRFPDPCDPLYTSEMLLGEPRPFLGMYLGRDGPPGSDYYAVPELLPMGNLLKIGYLHDGNSRDISEVRRDINREKKTIDIDRLMEYGGRRFLEDWKGTGKISNSNSE